MIHFRLTKKLETIQTYQKTRYHFFIYPSSYEKAEIPVFRPKL